MDNNNNEILQINYFQINHQNKLEFYKEDERNNFMLLLYTTLASMVDEELGQGMNKFFNKLIPSNDKDMLNVNMDLSRRYSKSYKIDINNGVLYRTINEILDEDYNLEFEFNKKNTSSLSYVLAYIFYYLSKWGKCKKYGIKNHKDFTDKCQQYRNTGFDITELYKNKKKVQDKEELQFDLSNDLDITHSQLKSISTKQLNLFNNSSAPKKQNYPKNISDFIDESEIKKKLFLENYSMSMSLNNGLKLEDTLKNKKSNFTFPITNVDKPKIPINFPNELLVILNKFQFIRKLIFRIEDIDLKRRDEILFILLNYNWLFPSVIHIDLDVNNDELLNQILNIHQKKLQMISKNTKRILKNTKYNENDSHNNNMNNYLYNRKTISETSTMIEDFMNMTTAEYLDNTFSETSSMRASSVCFESLEKNPLAVTSTIVKKDNKRSVTELIKSNFQYFETLIIFVYFIEQMKDNLRILDISIYNNYLYELEQLMISVEKLQIINLNIMNFFTKIVNLIEINIEFNSLDIKLFERLLGIINSNELLKKVKISFFIPEKFYSPSGLYQLCRNLSVNLKSVLDTNGQILTNDSVENYEIDHALIKYLLPSFEDNISKLFFVLCSKPKIQEMSFIFNIPSIIYCNDFYNIVIIKFIINYLLLLSYEKTDYRLINIYAPYIKFDGRKLFFLEELIDEIDLENNKVLQILYLQFQMYEVTNIENLISTNLLKLFLGDLDIATFSNFLDYFTSEEFATSSNLTYIKISLGVTVVLYDDVSEYIRKYYSNKTKNLREQNLDSYLIIQNNKQLDHLIDTVFFENKVNTVLVSIEKSNETTIIERVLERKNSIDKKIERIMNVFNTRYIFMNHENIQNKIKSFLEFPKNKGIVAKATSSELDL